MKNIEDKLDGFEQVISVLIRKISVLEERFNSQESQLDQKICTILAEIRVGMKVIHPSNRALLEIHEICNRTNRLLSAQERHKRTLLDFRTKGFLLSIAILACTTFFSVVSAKFLTEESNDLRQYGQKYAMAEVVNAELTEWIDSVSTANPNLKVDSLRLLWRKKMP